MNKKLIRTIALTFLINLEPVKRFGALLNVEKLLNEVVWTSYNKILKLFGLSYFAGIDSSSKIVKGQKLDYSTMILYLSASNNAGKDLCKFASTGCRLACLVASGRAIMSMKSEDKAIQVSRLIKSWLMIYRKDLAYNLLRHEIKKHSKKALKDGKGFAVRLNGTSDLNFNDIISEFPEIQFYDYTKDITRQSMDNYHVTFSYSETTQTRIKHYKKAILNGWNIAIPIISEDFEAACDLKDCYSMDDTDLRFLDNKGRYGILKAKVTPDLQEGIKNKFFLTLEELKELINTIEN